MNQPQEDSIVTIVVNAPIYLARYLIGMALGALTDITTTSLALGSIFLALATTAWAGLATFFLLHTVIKMVNALSGAQVRQGNLVGNAIMRHASVFAQQSSSPPSEPPQPTADATSEG